MFKSVSLVAIAIGFLTLIITPSAIAQNVPDAISYQAVARDNNGSPLVDSNLNVRLGILSESANGEVQYEEEHLVTTSELGLFNLMIGDGTNTGNGPANTISEVNWSQGTFFLKVEIDQGLGYEDIGTSQLLSVPYAFFSEVSQTAIDVDDADADPNNEAISEFELNGTDLNLTEGGVDFSVPLESLIDDADADPTNEIISQINLNGTDLELTEGGEDLSVSLESLVNDADADSTNELITDFSLSNSNLSITEGGETYNVDILSAFQDLDNDTTNEAISQFELNGTDLNLTEGGIDYSVPLESLIDDGDWEQDVGTVYNTTNNIGIGTSNPQSTLEVNGSFGTSFITSTGPANVVLDETHHVVLANASSGDVTVVLPSATTCPGRIYIIKRYGLPPSDPISFDVILNPPSSELVDGFSAPVLTGFERNNATIISDGSNWWVIEGKVTE